MMNKLGRSLGVIISTTLLLALISAPFIAYNLGIGAYAAKKIIDIAAGAGSIWLILAVVGGSFGWGAAVLATARWALNHFGRAAAASW